MNLENLHSKLVRIARANPPSDQVPYTFERRMMVRLLAHPLGDQWAFWARALWRATAPCIAVVLLLCAWSWLNPPAPVPSAVTPAVDVTQDLENTLLAAADQELPADSSR